LAAATSVTLVIEEALNVRDQATRLECYGEAKDKQGDVVRGPVKKEADAPSPQGGERMEG
jgi:hypothetical protein